MPGRSEGKTAVKTAVIVRDRRAPASILQPHGGALLPGGVPGNKGGTGRPRNDVRKAALEGAAIAVPRLQEIVSQPDSKARDVIDASRVLLEYGVGRQLEIEDTTQPTRLTGEGVMERVASLLPGMLSHGCFSVLQLLSFRDAIDRALEVARALAAAEG